MKIDHFLSFFIVGLLAAGIGMSACAGQGEQASGNARLKVVATTSIVGDVAALVGGKQIELSVLLPLGADPHSFELSPQDVAAVSEADLIFANGAGLETFLDNLIESAGAQDKVVEVSEGIDFQESAGELEASEEEHDHAAGIDPHTWTDPNNVMVWLQNIEAALSARDPAHASVYRANAEHYRGELVALDAWIREQVEQIPPAQRKIVTDHLQFGYFAAQYGFEQVGAILPGFSTLAQPSAQEMAALEDAIASLQVKAIFVGHNFNPSLAERVAEDTNTRLLFVYTGSLSEAGGEADTYLAYMRFNTLAFVEGLK
jgi:ABC-type Zn uptake system ZnuABC Zn-binding protein ZnuA